MTGNIRMAGPALTAAGGLCAGGAIRDAIHQGHDWPLMTAAAVLALIGAAAAIWLPYRAQRNELLRQREFLVRARDEVPGTVTQANITRSPGH